MTGSSLTSVDVHVTPNPIQCTGNIFYTSWEN